MDQRKSLIITALVLIFIIAVIVGTIIFLVRGVRTRSASENNRAAQATTVPMFSAAPDSETVPTFDTNPTPAASSQPTNPTPGTNNQLKVYNGPSYSLSYPKAWGILTCSNSSNIEFDPTSSTDQLNVRCDVALKPITILAGGNPSCQGETVKLGNVTVQRSVQQTATGKNYRWCSKTMPGLDITHRVSSTPSRATSTQDYASQIEEMIKTFKPGARS